MITMTNQTKEPWTMQDTLIVAYIVAIVAAAAIIVCVVIPAGLARDEAMEEQNAADYWDMRDGIEVGE